MIKKYIPLTLKTKIQKQIFLCKLKMCTKKIREKFGKCIIFISVPIHGNLGDQAIVYSQYKFFEEIGLKESIIEIENGEYLLWKDSIERIISSEDIIIIDGGGNMGNLWIHEEYKFRDIIKRFIRNKIIIFPETIYYSDDEFGKSELQESIKVYEAHKNLHLCVRDKKSYDLAIKTYKNIDVKFTPDIVLFLDQVVFNDNRNGAILCMRKDKEKEIESLSVKRVEDKLKNKNISFTYSSTLVEKNINIENREDELLKKWDEFSKAKIIITDRLHGMIFAAITGTPCIAINNSNGKVQGVYEWIKDINYIKFCSTVDEIENDIDELLDMDIRRCRYDFNKKYFDKIIEAITK